MRKLIWSMGILGLLGLLALPWWAQWGAIRSGIDAVRRGQQESQKPSQPHKAYEGSASMQDTKTGVSTAPVTYNNKVRNFSYTIPAGWRLERGNPTGAADRTDIIFMKPGTTCGFTIHWTQMVPSFPRQASVNASYKQAREEKTIGKYISVKRRNQKVGKRGIIGWETIETAAKGSGGFQRIQWQCYDSNNYMYSFMAASEPKDFNANRAQMQQLINSIRFSR